MNPIWVPVEIMRLLADLNVGSRLTVKCRPSLDGVPSKRWMTVLDSQHENPDSPGHPGMVGLVLREDSGSLWLNIRDRRTGDPLSWLGWPAVEQGCTPFLPAEQDTIIVYHAVSAI